MPKEQIFTNPFRYLEENAAVSGSETALITPLTTKSWSELLDLSQRLAAKLRFSGVRPGDRVMLALNKTNSWIFQLALFHEATVSVAANAKGLSTLKIDWLITDQLGSGFSADRTFLIDQSWISDAESRFKAQDVLNYDPGDLIRISFTSGTTGTPKAIPITAEILQRRYDQDELFWEYPKPYLGLLGFDSAIGFQGPVRALVGGLPYYALSVKDGNKWDFINRNKIRTLEASPIQMTEMMSVLPDNLDLSHLELVRLSGSVIPSGLVTRLKTRLGVVIWNGYGSNEASGAARSIVEIGSDPSLAGKPDKKAQVVILDDNFSELPVGVVGRVAVRNRSMVHEYLDNPDATKEFFVNGWFLPGDLGKLDEQGRLWLQGRSSEVINAGGKKINPDVVDDFLKSQPGVIDAATFAFQDKDGLTWSVAAVVGNSELSMKVLAANMRKTLNKSGAKILIPVKAIPRNENGKVIRGRLQEENQGVLQKLLNNR